MAGSTDNEMYRVEITYWYRDRTGDWDTSDYWTNFETLQEALDYIQTPGGDKKNLIDGKIYDCRLEYKVIDTNIIYHYRYKDDYVIRNWTNIKETGNEG